MVKNNKRFLSFFCCLALILALFPPLPASAAVASDHVTESSGDGFALYNGVKLPNIDSVWTDKESYPYLRIYTNSSRSTYWAFISSENVYFKPSNYNLYWNNSGSAVQFLLSDGVWTSIGSVSFYANELNLGADNYPVVFVTSDIINTTDNSIYLSATSPIPLDGMTVIEWDGDTTGLTAHTFQSGVTSYVVADYSGASSAVAVAADGTVFQNFTSGSSWSVGGAAFADPDVGIGLSVFPAGDTYCSLLAYSPAADPLTTIVTVDGQEYLYTGDSTEMSPMVNLVVAEDRITIAGASGTYVLEPPEGYKYLGLSGSSASSDLVYDIGTYTLGREAANSVYTLFTVTEALPPTLTTTVTIDGVEHIFTGDSTELSPLVQLIVAEDTITLAGASGTYTFTPPEGNIFLGLAPSSSVAPSYPIGTYTLGREDTNSVYTLYTVLESLGPLLDTAVNVYSNSGTTLHDSYAASGYGTAPALTLMILDNGLQISNSAGVVSSWTAADPDFFLGFAMQRNATTPSFRPGQTFSIGGGSTDVLTDLYVVYSPGYSDINDFEVSSWLVSAVGGFLDFQLWPGMSLNEVMWIILVAGVLFWFLKLTI